MSKKAQNIFKYISSTSLLLGVVVWIWYIISNIILGKMSYGEIIMTVPIGILGVMSGIISQNEKLIIFNFIQASSLIVVLLIIYFYGAIRLIII
ncbi:hypothetical protein Curi_c23390 [Gottschalkia acidurici 9a]|uniref:Uncharacterized protein n=1 Tax=Gottschalkia acidurici (strain ATCC 7906 / DSM 604 / BCRC 14475 / CIP 104303 / KCTC 5404 / NCIMB 10678 / 9a) TaxID=1128398 RepID=K0B456_GOTA9|nr:hypothetical protein [Gottschalkia acidurici]AFS79341.1 hypothetical protein Curi_c23390 [Gottschalkia acidurici 9a]